MQSLVGQRFGRLVVRAKSASRPNGIHWSCDCDCGNKVTATTGHLRSSTRSCGCWKREVTARRMRKYRAECEIEPHLKHGHYAGGKMSATYRSWHAMIQRCTNPNRGDYDRYGGRGITVCDQWRDFVVFLADMGERPEGKTLDRKNNDKGYYKRNCRWATDAQQRANKRSH